MENKEFLQGYEMKGWDRNPRMYKIIAFSTIFTLFAVFAVAQTNLLQAKACDSYYIGKVCQTLDSVYVATIAYTGNEGYVVKDYERTQIDDSDVMWVDQTGAGPKFTYPEGYFPKEQTETVALPGENPVSFDPIPPPSTTISPPASKPEPSQGGIWSVKPKVPKRNVKIISGEIPDSIISTAEDGKEGDGNATGGKGEKPKDADLEKNTAKNSSPVDGIEINKKPLYDFADEALEKYSNKTVDFSEQFKVKLSGQIDQNGHLDPKKTRYTEAVGDPEMVEVAKRAIESVGESGWLNYLSSQGIKNLSMIFAQNDSNLMAQVDGQMPNADEAATVASGLRGLVQYALLGHNNNMKRLKDDEVALLKAATIKSDGKIVRIDFILEKPAALGIIKARLSEYQAEKNKTKGKPNGNSEKPSGDDKTAR